MLYDKEERNWLVDHKDIVSLIFFMLLIVASVLSGYGLHALIADKSQVELIRIKTDRIDKRLLNICGPLTNGNKH